MNKTIISSHFSDINKRKTAIWFSRKRSRSVELRRVEGSDDETPLKIVL